MIRAKVDAGGRNFFGFNSIRLRCLCGQDNEIYVSENMEYCAISCSCGRRYQINFLLKQKPILPTLDQTTERIELTDDIPPPPYKIPTPPLIKDPGDFKK